MRPTDRQLSAVAAILFLLLSVRGGAPSGDFANYWTSAVLVAEGTGLERIYDYRWFTEQAARVGFGDRPVGFAVLPPPSALVLLPLVPLGREGAEIAWALLQPVLLLCSAWLAARAVRLPGWTAVLGLALAWPAIASHLGQGQIHCVALLALALGFNAFVRQRDATAGLCWAIAIGLKVHAWPVVLVAGLLGRWRIVGAAVLTLLTGGLISVSVLGWEVHGVFFTEIAPAAASGWFTDPWAVSFQSLPGTLRRLFVAHPGLNPTPLANQPALAAGWSAGLVVFGLLIGGVSWDRRRPREALALGAMTALCFGALLARYHLVLLVVPVLWLWGVRPALRLPLGLCLVGATWVPAGSVSPRLLFVLGLWTCACVAAGCRPRGWHLLVAMLCGGVATALSRPLDVYALDHPELPLIAADLLVDDGVLYFSGLPLPRHRDVPGQGWVGYRWVPGERPRIVAWNPRTHVWSPTKTQSGVRWAIGPGHPLGATVQAGWQLSDAGAGVRALRPRPTRDVFSGR